MTIAVLTVTCRYGGVDVAAASVKRQHREDLVWLVGDELARVRPADVWWRAAPCEAYVFDTAALKHDGMARTLSAANNEGLRRARALDVDMLVLLNDYVWAPPDGIDAFIRMAQEHPRSLLTGACSISDDPGVDQVTDPKGLHSIFEKPYLKKPKKIGWRDCRFEMYSGVQRIAESSWEGNWAAIPREILHDENVNFDPAYDRGHYYDNQAYALQAMLNGYDAWIDCDNEAISLPHKAYFAEDQAELEGMNNRAFHEARLREMNVTQTFVAPDALKAGP